MCLFDSGSTLKCYEAYAKLSLPYCFYQALLAQDSIEQSARAYLDFYRNRLHTAEGELSRKDLEREAIAGFLKLANVEIKKLKTELEKEQKHTHGLVDFYNEYDAKLEALRHERDEALATAETARGEAACLSTKITELAKSACYTLRLVLTDFGAKADEAPAEDAVALAFMDWTQQAGGAVAKTVANYGDCCARVSAALCDGRFVETWLQTR